jgi:hypothetical protein
VERTLNRTGHRRVRRRPIGIAAALRDSRFAGVAAGFGLGSRNNAKSRGSIKRASASSRF